MFEQKNKPIADSEKEEVLHLLSEVYKNPHLSQRDISSRLNVSLGKTNYLLNALVNRGVLTIKDFSREDGKLRKVKYVLTRKGFQEKIKLTYYFLKRKEEEYNRLKEEWEQLTVVRR